MTKANSKGDASTSKLISKYIAELTDWRGKTLARIRKVFHEADPAIIEEWKWTGSPVWSHNGLVSEGSCVKAFIGAVFCYAYLFAY